MSATDATDRVGTDRLATDRLDHLDAALALSSSGILGVFNRAGVLAAADVHVAVRLGRLGGDGDELVALAAALAVRAPRFGHVHVDLATVQDTAAADVEEAVDVAALPWPEPGGWVRRLAGSPLVAVGPDGAADRPLRLVGTALYLDRYWRDEAAVAVALASRASGVPPVVDEALLAAGLARLFPGDDAVEQRWAAAVAVLRRLSVIAGGPGTGKTTTVARVLALLAEQAAGTRAPAPLVALAAPTGKAAARLEEAVHTEAGRLDVPDGVRRLLLGAGASTIHRLLGTRPGTSSRFRHDRHNRLPHDVVVVDETSMVALPLMARLAEAVRSDARLVLVGDPEQLASVEAGAVLGDIVGPALAGPRLSAPARSLLGRVTGAVPPAAAAAVTERAGGAEAGGAGPGSVGDGIVVLRANHRFHGALADLAAAIRTGDADRAVEVLAAGDPAVRWLPVDVETAAAGELEPVRSVAVEAGARLVEAAGAGDAGVALDALDRLRVLCAHRRGPAGVSTWTARVEEWLAEAVDGFAADGAWYSGRPVIVTANDYGLRLFNGDTGATVARTDGRLGVAFRRGASVVSVSPSRLAAVDTVFAMTVHKAQGSEFDEVAILLPAPSSRVLTRELLYTAVTRARQRVLLAAGEESVRAAVGRPVARASGLTARLWGPAGR